MATMAHSFFNIKATNLKLTTHIGENSIADVSMSLQMLDAIHIYSMSSYMLTMSCAYNHLQLAEYQCYQLEINNT